ncbi:ECF transporter S component [Enterococcus olivae]
MNNKVQKMVSIALFASMGLVLQYVAFPIIPMFEFLKVDFSDIPVMLSMFLFGPVAGIVTAFLRSSLHLLTTGLSAPNMVGDVASFIATTVFTLPMYYFFNKSYKSSYKISGVVSGILSMSIVMSIANYFVITPLYLFFFNVGADNFLGMPLANYVVMGILPFNLIKGTIVSVVFLILHAKLLPWLSKKQSFIEQRTFSK